MTTFSYPIPLRWVDLDAQGHVNNALITDYLQEARVAFLLSGPNAHLLGNGIMVVAHQVEYLRPVVFSLEPVLVDLQVGEVGASRFTIGYDVRQDGEVAARARTTMCVYDFDAGRPRRMTDAERTHFAGLSVDLQEFRPLGRWRVSEASHEYEFVVRWSDLDSYGHVNNVKFFDFVAEGRVTMTLGPGERSRMEAAADAGYLWMVVRQDVEYVRSIEHRLQPYRVRTGVAGLGRTSMTFAAQIEDPLDSSILGRSVTVLVSADDEGRPIPIPGPVVHYLEHWPALPRN